MEKRELGSIGEDTAAMLLSCKGYRIITRNYRCRYGEIDIIAMRGGCLHFIEVKTRQGTEYGLPSESVNVKKREHIRKAAVFYLKELKMQGLTVPRINFQVIGITIDQIENAF